MELKKFFSLLLIFFLFFGEINNQKSQPLNKRADNIISGYIKAIGGAKNLNNIKSYRIKGIANFFGMKVTYTEYCDSTKYLMNLGDDTLKIIKLVINDKERWVESVKEGEDTVSVVDISDEHHASWNNYLLRYNFIYFFQNYKKYGLTLNLDSTKDKPVSYEINFSKNDTIMCRARFSPDEFLLKKFVVETPSETILGFHNLSYVFDDYTEIAGTNLKLPRTIIRNDLVPIEVTEYILNNSIEDSLIQKPNR